MGGAHPIVVSHDPRPEAWTPITVDGDADAILGEAGGQRRPGPPGSLSSWVANVVDVSEVPHQILSEKRLIDMPRGPLVAGITHSRNRQRRTERRRERVLGHLGTREFGLPAVRADSAAGGTSDPAPIADMGEMVGRCADGAAQAASRPSHCGTQPVTGTAQDVVERVVLVVASRERREPRLGVVQAGGLVARRPGGSRGGLRTAPKRGRVGWIRLRLAPTGRGALCGHHAQRRAPPPCRPRARARQHRQRCRSPTGGRDDARDAA